MEELHLEIRKASKKDLAGVARVYVDSWWTTYRGLVPGEYLDGLSYEDAEKRWADFLQGGNEPIIYAAVHQSGKIIGFAAGRKSDDEHFKGELYSLYLLQECKGQGLGKQLLSAIANHFKENGISSMMVWVMKKNQSGRGFYERMGGKEYIPRTSTFGGTVVDDVAYGWEDIAKLCLK